MDADSRKRVLVTGASGFIGRSLCPALKAKDYFVRAVVRNCARDISGVDEYIQIKDISALMDWQRALAGVDVVIHLAARVHIMQDLTSHPLEVFRKVNVLGTESLARMAAKAKIGRFIFISSVKVNGEGSSVAYTETDAPRPQDDYGRSKMEAEQVLAAIAAETGLATVILRLPLVYGPGVKANFKSLISAVSFGLPLPFKKISNRRSFLYLGNLVDAICSCISHPKAAGETFLVSDGQDISTPDLIKLIALAMQKNVVLFFLPSGILKALSRITSRVEVLEKLTGSLFIDNRKISDLLGWKPPFTLEMGMRETVRVKC